MYDEAELPVFVPVSLVCQYQVSPAGGVAAKFMVTPSCSHCGELELGANGLAGTNTTTEGITVPFNFTLSNVHFSL